MEQRTCMSGGVWPCVSVRVHTHVPGGVRSAALLLDPGRLSGCLCEAPSHRSGTPPHVPPNKAVPQASHVVPASPTHYRGLLVTNPDPVHASARVSQGHMPTTLLGHWPK